ncbi:MerR family DNA-binding transcriptional regulator [Listeria valentina]|uniref:MerR family DNA-binding transcriptional regulator n=1 Tax=Listeria valentina TaxID=2705293 RepID=UPI001431C7C8|nr:MerR family DNA-binding transcriptional regulator [Listeria valentina]
MKTYRSNEMANLVKVSTTTLRRYEMQGLIPTVLRTKSGHRIYTDLHYFAFTTIRQLLKSFPIPVVYRTMRLIKNSQVTEALWLLNEHLATIQAEKGRITETLLAIQKIDFTPIHQVRSQNAMTIGEVAKIAQVKTSAIRHWEQEGLIHSERKAENGYRSFSITELRKILVISSLRKTVYYIENIKQLLEELDTNYCDKLEHAIDLALEKLNDQLKNCYQGIAKLVLYIDLLNIPNKEHKKED